MMPYFAEIDSAGLITSVIVADLAFVKSGKGGRPDKFVEGFPGGGARKNFPGKGYTYQTNPDRFVSPQPFPSWSLNNGTGRWQAPVGGPPQNGRFYHWDEGAQGWVEHQAAKGN